MEVKKPKMSVKTVVGIAAYLFIGVIEFIYMMWMFSGEKPPRALELIRSMGVTCNYIKDAVGIAKSNSQKKKKIVRRKWTPMAAPLMDYKINQCRKKHPMRAASLMNSDKPGEEKSINIKIKTPGARPTFNG